MTNDTFRLSPIDKPTATEIATAKIILDRIDKDGSRLVRYLIKSTNPPHDGKCGVMDQMFEVHIAADGECATWWQVFNSYMSPL